MKQREIDIDGLVQSSQWGDQDAFTELYDHFMPLVFRYIRARVSTEQLAEDITSDVFLKLVNNLQKYKKKKAMPFGAWLFRIAKNTLIDHYRRHHDADEIAEDVADESINADTTADTKQHVERDRLIVAIAKLPKMQADAVSLKYFSERTNAEIAIILEKSETAVRILQSRGLKKLKTLL